MNDKNTWFNYIPRDYRYTGRGDELSTARRNQKSNSKNIDLNEHVMN